MHDVTGNSHQSIDNTQAKYAVHQDGATNSFAELCDEQTSQLPETSNCSPPPNTESSELTNRARAGSVLHEQARTFPPKFASKSEETIRATLSVPSKRTSKSLEAASSLASRPDSKKPGEKQGVKAFFTKLLTPSKGSLRSAEKKLSTSRMTIDLSDSANDGLITLLDQGKKLFATTESLANTCKNLIDVIDLSVPEDMKVQDFSDHLVAELANFQQAVADKVEPLPTIQGKEVPQKDINSIRNLARQILTDDICKGLFTDVIQRKENAKQNRAFLSNTVLEAMNMIKTPEDIKLLSTYLMSECTINAGILRVIKPDSLKTLLTDERIASTPALQAGIKAAAHAVMNEAVRRSQSNIVFQEVKASGRADWKSECQTWDTTAKGFGDEHHDLNGVNHIAKKAGLKLRVEPKNGDANQIVLQETLELKQEVHKILK